MIYCKHVFEKTFTDEVSKQAYLKACKWLAQNVYNNVELASSTVVSIVKKTDEETEFPAFVVSVYTKNDEEESRKDFCNKCKTLHTIFYSIGGMNCGECKAGAYYKKLDDDIKHKAKFIKEVLEDKE